MVYYTLAASATGAVPVPAASAAIIAENGVMLSHIASAMGTSIRVSTVRDAIGVATTVNFIGRTLFIEGAKLLSWGTGSVWALAALSALGASTAGLQTYLIGKVAIEIGKNYGKPLEPTKVKKIIKDAKKNYSSFVDEWKSKGVSKPGPA